MISDATKARFDREVPNFLLIKSNLLSWLACPSCNKSMAG